MKGTPARSTWWGRRGIRARSTIVVVVTVALTLALGAATVVLVVQAALTNSVTETVTQRAQEITGQIAADDLDAAATSAQATPGDLTVVQVLDSTGAVLVASPAITGEPALANPTTDPAITTDRVTPAFADGSDYVVAVQAAPGNFTVVAAASLADATRVSQVVLLGFLGLAPLVLLAVAGLTWYAVGRSLRDVDRIRSQVEDIGIAQLDERVAVPPTRDELEKLAVTMNGMLDRLEVSVERQRQFVADASHELKSPLASMRASLDTTGEGVNADVLREEVDRLNSLVGDLLVLARTDAALPVRREEVDLDEVVESVVSASREITNVHLRCVTEPVRLLADRAYLERIFRNLVDNAVRHASSRVEVELGRTGEVAFVTVSDDGPGIPAADRERVFERFVRLDEHRARRDGGSGLGLPIVRELVLAHGGTITLGDSPLGGAQVRVSLPTTGSSR